jgi:hypothetical protein
LHLTINSKLFSVFMQFRCARRIRCTAKTFALLPWSDSMSARHRRGWHKAIPYMLIPILLICYFVVPVGLEALDAPADPNQNKCLPGSPNDPIQTPRPNSGVVKLIRLTNAGAFVNRCEFTDALDELVWDRLPKGAFGPPRILDAKSLPRFTILYVHGWKHGADATDSDLTEFKRLIGRLADANPDRQVLGVYIAWNAACGLGVVDNLSFWSKKLIADRIAQSAVVTKIVGAIGASRKKTADAADQFIAIGHSFGARLLFSGAGQILIDETERAHPGFPGGQYRLVSGPADAVVLLNPAFEASLFTTFNSVTRNEEKFSENQAPLVLSIATDADYATRYAFPVGQWLGGMTDAKERTTLGNYEEFFTHLLAPSRHGSCNAAGKFQASEQFEAGGLCLQRQAFGRDRLVYPYNPFIVARASREVMGGHNDIWNPTFSNWLFRLIDALRERHEESDAKNSG